MTSFHEDSHVFKSAKIENVIDEAVSFFAKTPIQQLPPTERFIGSGVYALYYHGDFVTYSKIAQINRRNCELPIYVGKALPAGWRTARVNITETANIYNRLREHFRSIEQANNLLAKDFSCRFMILDEPEADLVGTIEARLIRKFTPLWNVAIDGFGNHDPGSGRYNQAKSEWDIIHPGRKWADKLIGEASSMEAVIEKVRQYMNSLNFF